MLRPERRENGQQVWVWSHAAAERPHWSQNIYELKRRRNVTAEVYDGATRDGAVLHFFGTHVAILYVGQIIV